MKRFIETFHTFFFLQFFLRNINIDNELEKFFDMKKSKELNISP